LAIGNLLKSIFGTKSERDLKVVAPLAEEINEWYHQFASLSDDELPGKTSEFKKRLAEGETVDDLLPEAFALVKEACRRLVGKTWDVTGFEVTWDMIPFDVQLYGAIVLHQGKIAEMATGEGKTLVATMPLYLNALEGKGAHLVTVNDYLARRDSEWMGKIFETLGLTVGCIQSDMDPEQRKTQYACDITYGTNNEFGFDYLRDNMAVSLEQRVQNQHHYAIVDEVDSVLIDEARTPLIISGPVEHSTQRFQELKPMVEKLVRSQTQLIGSIVKEALKLYENPETQYEAGVKLLQAHRGFPKHRMLMRALEDSELKKLMMSVEADLIRNKALTELDDDLLFSTEEKTNIVALTDHGTDVLSPSERDLFVLPDLSEGLQNIDDDPDLSAEEKVKLKEELHLEYADKNDKIHDISQLLKAYTLFEKNVEYVVQDGRVMIVDEFTGRILPGRRYSDGLHQAIEAKENVTIQKDTQTLATITLQNYFRLYDKLAGMTGTAETEANEFMEIYKLDVVVIPTNEPVRRIDYDDRIYRTRREKFNAVLDEIEYWHQKKRPILVGTTSVEASEVISRMLKSRKIKHNVLNARHHQKEAEIIANAGGQGAVTIATNMAGRGTDIKLGKGVVKCERCCVICEEKNCEACPNEHGDISEQCEGEIPCGLHIIGTERHESRRIDRQLRGRSGRQGDPGSSTFFLSLEDDLMRLFGSDRLSGVMSRLGAKEGEVIQHRLVTNAIERAQKRVEAYHFDIRKHLLEYDDVMNQQRDVIYNQRLKVLESDDLEPYVKETIEQVVDDRVAERLNGAGHIEDWDVDGLRQDFQKLFLVQPEFLHGQLSEDATADELKERVMRAALGTYENKKTEMPPDVFDRLQRYVFLSTIDSKWKDHLYELDNLKGGIGLRAFGQKNPLLEYKSEAFKMFEELMNDVHTNAVELLFRARLVPREQPQQPEQTREVRPTLPGPGMAGREQKAGEPARAAAPREIRRNGKKVGRNDPCPCGSGKKFKKCCGR
jgi:preprotein translocase subunit SecA